RYSSNGCGCSWPADQTAPTPYLSVAKGYVPSTRDNLRALERPSTTPGAQSTATREIRGIVSLSSSSHFPLSSGWSGNILLLVPPGRARLLTNPASIGSDSRSSATIGTVLDMLFAARTRGRAGAEKTSTLRVTRFTSQ